jgi:hypothetical protein
MWGIIPAAGAGSRIQPLAFSKELLPVGSRVENGRERPRAVSEYLVERMICGGADKLCFVIAPGKTDILQYYGSRLWGASIAYVVQPNPGGLCDAVFRAAPLVHPDEAVLIGLPDTIWSPENGLQSLPENCLSFLLFPVEQPEFFDAVVMDDDGAVRQIQVKQRGASSNWIWGAIKMPGAAGRVLWHAGECVACGRRHGGRREGRSRVCGCGHAAWIPGGGPHSGTTVGREARFRGRQTRGEAHGWVCHSCPRLTNSSWKKK